MPTHSPRSIAPGLFLALFVLNTAQASDPIKELQNAYVANKSKKIPRLYHFGSQGPGDIFSNHTSHSNRLIPVYVFGRKADLRHVTGKNSIYRDPEKIRRLYGTVPANTLNPGAEYCDQSDLCGVQKDAVGRGAKYLFTVWFDGMDWETTRAAAIEGPEGFTRVVRARGWFSRTTRPAARPSSVIASRARPTTRTRPMWMPRR